MMTSSPQDHTMTSATGEASAKRYSRSSDFWYHEGNIVLHVENTLFRVHTGVLQTHSEVFKDAFTIPQPHTFTDTDLYEGCQVVKQHFDSVKDWAVLLTFIYKPLQINPLSAHVPVDVLFSLMRLANKYCFDDVFDIGLHRLTSELPVALSHFDEAHPPLMPGVYDKGTPYTGDVASLTTVINHAMELGIECVLPCAYYLMMTRFSIQDIVMGVVLPDGTRVTLNQTAKECILTGMAKLHPTMMDSFARWLYDLDPDKWKPYCADYAWLWNSEIQDSDDLWPDCRKAIPAVRSRMIQYIRHRQFALAPCRQGDFFESTFSDLCVYCQQGEMKMFQEKRRAFWEGLPAFFEVGRCWKSLRYYPHNIESPCDV